MSSDDVDLWEALRQQQAAQQPGAYIHPAMGMGAPYYHYYAAGMSQQQMNASWQAQAGAGTSNLYAQSAAQFDAYLGYLNQIAPTQTPANEPDWGPLCRGARIRAWWGRLLARVRRLRAWWWAHVEAGGYARQVARVLERRARQAREGGL